MYIIGVCFAVMVAAAFFLNNGRQITYSFQDDILSLNYPEQESIRIPGKEIVSIQTTEEFDVGSEAGGLVKGSLRYGAFRNDTLGDYQAALSTRVPLVILIETAGERYAINFENKSSTESLSEAIGKLIE